MNLLFGTCYDPTSAVTAFTTSTTGVAIVAFDTTNLRATFTVPPSGYVRVRMSAQVHGATTYPTILFAVMSGAGIVKRQSPMQSLGNTAVATARVKTESDFIVSGLTAGEAKTWDAGYGIEVGIASTGVKYGGPNDAIANNAFGGFAFEVWDPCPFYTPASGVPPTTPVIAYTSGIKTKTDFLPSATAGAAGGVQIAGTNAATVYASVTCSAAFSINGVSNVAQTGDAFNIVKSGGTGDNAAIKAKTDLIPAAPASTTNITAGTITTVTNLTNAPSAGDFTATMKTSLNAATPASVTGSVGSVVGLTASNLDATVSSRLATAGYTAPDNASITTILADVSGLSVTDITAIKAKTDSLNFTVAGQVDGNIHSVKDTAVTGVGTAGNPWGPL